MYVVFESKSKSTYPHQQCFYNVVFVTEFKAGREKIFEVQMKDKKGRQNVHYVSSMYRIVQVDVIGEEK